jgi:hypothetical protein
VTDATIVPIKNAVFNPLPALPLPSFPPLELGLNELAFVRVVSLFRIAEVVGDDADASNVDISDLVLLKVELGICWIAEAVKMKGAFAPAWLLTKAEFLFASITKLYKHIRKRQLKMGAWSTSRRSLLIMGDKLFFTGCTVYSDSH